METDHLNSNPLASKHLRETIHGLVLTMNVPVEEWGRTSPNTAEMHPRYGEEILQPTEVAIELDERTDLPLMNSLCDHLERRLGRGNPVSTDLKPFDPDDQSDPYDEPDPWGKREALEIEAAESEFNHSFSIGAEPWRD